MRIWSQDSVLTLVDVSNEAQVEGAVSKSFSRPWPNRWPD
jgi:hypothetical protein